MRATSSRNASASRTATGLSSAVSPTPCPATASSSCSRPDPAWGITLYKRDERGGKVATYRLDAVHTQDEDRGPKTLRLRMDQLPRGVVLSFEKAKAFGAHTPMYCLFLYETDDDLAGQRITFRWEEDR